jgi:hypothetical protein
MKRGPTRDGSNKIGFLDNNRIFVQTLGTCDSRPNGYKILFNNFLMTGSHLNNFLMTGSHHQMHTLWNMQILNKIIT